MSGYTIKPMTEDELTKEIEDARPILPDGVYDFEVIKAEEQISKSGNPMAKVQLRIWDADGVVRFVTDYLVFSDNAFCIRKIRHFCASVGLLAEFNKGEIPQELDMRSGKVLIGLDELRAKPEGGFYSRKNKVVDYVAAEEGSIPAKAPMPVHNDFDDKDIPF